MYYCKVCGQNDLLGLSGHHTRCAINKPVAINNAINTKAVALVVPEPKKTAVVVSSGLRSANRRSKEDYNEYMKGYMQRYRACPK